MTPTIPAEDIARRIRAQMQIKSLTIRRAAEACGLTKPSFEEYIYAKSLPGAAALAALSRGLGCTTDWLLFGEVAQ